MASGYLAGIAMEEQHRGLARGGRRIPQHDGLSVRSRHPLLGNTGEAQRLRRRSGAGGQILEAALLEIHVGGDAQIGRHAEQEETAEEHHHAAFSLAGVAVSLVQHHSARSGESRVMVA